MTKHEKYIQYLDRIHAAMRRKAVEKKANKPDDRFVLIDAVTGKFEYRGETEFFGTISTQSKKE